MIAEEVEQRSDHFLICVIQGVWVDADPRAVGVDTGGEELLRGCRIAEHVEDSRGGRKRLNSEVLFNPASQLRLFVELLECAGPGHESVTEWPSDEIRAHPRSTARTRLVGCAPTPRRCVASRRVRPGAR